MQNRTDRERLCFHGLQAVSTQDHIRDIRLQGRRRGRDQHALQQSTRHLCVCLENDFDDSYDDPYDPTEFIDEDDEF